MPLTSLENQSKPDTEDDTLPITSQLLDDLSIKKINNIAEFAKINPSVLTLILEDPSTQQSIQEHINQRLISPLLKHKERILAITTHEDLNHLTESIKQHTAILTELRYRKATDRRGIDQLKKLVEDIKNRITTLTDISAYSKDNMTELSMTTCQDLVELIQAVKNYYSIFSPNPLPQGTSKVDQGEKYPIKFMHYFFSVFKNLFSPCKHDIITLAIPIHQDMKHLIEAISHYISRLEMIPNIHIFFNQLTSLSESSLNKFLQEMGKKLSPMTDTLPIEKILSTRFESEQDGQHASTQKHQIIIRMFSKQYDHCDSSTSQSSSTPQASSCC